MKKPGLIERVLQKAIDKMTFPQGGGSSFLMPQSVRDYASKVGQGDRSSVLMAPLLWIARRFAEAKYMMTKDGEPLDDHDVLKLLRRPNPYYSGRLLRMAMENSFDLDGNVYLIKVRNKQLKPVELWYVPHWLMEPHWPQDGSVYIDYYTYSTPRGQQTILPEDVIHVRCGIDPLNIRKGYSKLKPLMREIFTDDEAANFSSSLLVNMGVPGLIISPGAENAKISDDDKKAVEERFNSGYVRDGRGRTVVFRTKTEIEQFGFSPQTMDLSVLRAVPEERVCAILGVAAAVVGFGSGLAQTKVGATMREMRESSYEDCIIPMQNLFADEFDTQLVPDFEEEPERFKVDFDLTGIRVLMEDENARSVRIRGEMKDSMITLGEARKKLGYEVRPEHDVYLLPFNVTPTPASMLDEPLDPVATTAPVENQKYILPAGITKARGWKGALIKALKKDFEKLSSKFAPGLRKAFDKLGDQAADMFEIVAHSRGMKEHTPPTKDDRANDEAIANIMMEDMDFDIADYGPHFSNTMKQTFDTIEAIINLSVFPTPEAEKEILALGGKRLGLLDIKGDTRKAIFKALEEGRAAGDGPYAIASRIREYVGGGRWNSATYRAKLIARTETKFAQNWSSLEAYKEGGIDTVEILDGRLPTSDQECIDRSGDKVTLDEAFAMSEEEHPNGTLSWVPVVGDFQG